MRAPADDAAAVAAGGLLVLAGKLGVGAVVGRDCVCVCVVFDEGFCALMWERDMNTSQPVCVCVCVRACVRVCVYAYICIHIYIHIYIYIYIYIYAQAQNIPEVFELWLAWLLQLMARRKVGV